jgi:hypothetical protein
MTRRPALVTQADVARAGRAAKQLGPEWRVEIEGAIIRLVQSPPLGRPSLEPEPRFARGLANAP